MSWKEKYSKNLKDVYVFDLRSRLFLFIGIIVALLITKFILLPLRILRSNTDIMIFLLISVCVLMIMSIIYALKKGRE